MATTCNDPPIAGGEAVAAFKKLDSTEQTMHSRSVPTPNRLPPVSLQRRTDSLNETPFDLADNRTASLPYELGPSHTQPRTVLYLAYGSNLCSETFKGVRGIKPLAEINVVVPELVLTFNLAGIPYTEPCFANTRYRNSSTDIPSHSPASNDEKAPLLPTHPPNQTRKKNYHNPSWPKGLVGVVYEVTLTDYAHIIATEGAGSSYQDVLATCYELPPSSNTVPANPTSTPFKAHTLYSPVYPPGKAPPDKRGRFSRPDPDYAQPSARYLKLIRDGADEHSIPDEYKSYLRELVPYTITTRRQRIGKKIFTGIWWPVVRAVLSLSAKFVDEKGKSPKWVGTVMAAVFRGVWASYDGGFRYVFGDGERTIEGEAAGGGEWWKKQWIGNGNGNMGEKDIEGFESFDRCPQTPL